MNCKVCKNKIIKNDNDVHVCSSCGHIFRNYNGDHVKYHKEIYRKASNKKQQRGQGEINPDGSINKKFHIVSMTSGIQAPAILLIGEKK